MAISIGYTPRWRSLRDLHHRGPQARGSVRSIETESRSVTNLYHGLGAYAIATYSNTIQDLQLAHNLGLLAAITRQYHRTSISNDRS